MRELVCKPRTRDDLRRREVVHYLFASTTNATIPFKYTTHTLVAQRLWESRKTLLTLLHSPQNSIDMPISRPLLVALIGGEVLPGMRLAVSLHLRRLVAAPNLALLDTPFQSPHLVVSEELPRVCDTEATQITLFATAALLALAHVLVQALEHLRI